MDYKIKLEAQGIGKRTAGMRQKAIQASQRSASKAGTTAAGGRQTVTAIKALNSSILKLIASNKALMRSMGAGAGRGAATGAVGRGVGATARGAVSGAAGFGKIGAAIPILGAGIAAMGFTIQKINQIGNAFIQTAGQQLGTAGVGGFRRGKGLYTGAQLGAGMKAFGMATGEFQTQYETRRVKSGDFVPESEMKKWSPSARRAQRRKNYKSKTGFFGKKVEQTPLDVAAIYGLAPGEALQTAGQFQRAGADYREAVGVGMGAGIQTELPALLSGMANLLTESVREGVNTSDMSKDMAKEISALTAMTPGKSVEAAMNIVKGFRGVKKQVAGGQMGTVQGLYTAQAAQSLLMEKLTGEGRQGFVEGLQQRNLLTGKQGKNILSQLGKDSSFDDLMKISPSAAHPLLRQFTSEVGSASISKRIRQNMQSQFGKGAKGFQRASDFMTSTGWNLNQSQMLNWWRTGDIPKEAEAKGMGELGQRRAGVERTGAGMAARQEVSRKNLVLDFGGKFAATSRRMEEAMFALARDAAPAAEKGLTAVGKAATKMIKSLDGLTTRLDNVQKEQGVLNKLGALFGG